MFFWFYLLVEYPSFFNKTGKSVGTVLTYEIGRNPTSAQSINQTMTLHAGIWNLEYYNCGFSWTPNYAVTVGILSGHEHLFGPVHKNIDQPTSAFNYNMHIGTFGVRTAEATVTVGYSHRVGGTVTIPSLCCSTFTLTQLL